MRRRDPDQLADVDAESRVRHARLDCCDDSGFANPAVDCTEREAALMAILETRARRRRIASFLEVAEAARAEAAELAAAGPEERMVLTDLARPAARRGRTAR